MNMKKKKAIKKRLLEYFCTCDVVTGGEKKNNAKKQQFTSDFSSCIPNALLVTTRTCTTPNSYLRKRLNSNRSRILIMLPSNNMKRISLVSLLWISLRQTIGRTKVSDHKSAGCGYRSRTPYNHIRVLWIGMNGEWNRKDFFFSFHLIQWMQLIRSFSAVGFPRFVENSFRLHHCESLEIRVHISMKCMKATINDTTKTEPINKHGHWWEAEQIPFLIKLQMVDSCLFLSHSPQPIWSKQTFTRSSTHTE